MPVLLHTHRNYWSTVMFRLMSLNLNFEWPLRLCWQYPSILNDAHVQLSPPLVEIYDEVQTTCSATGCQAVYARSKL